MVTSTKSGRATVGLSSVRLIIPIAQGYAGINFPIQALEFSQYQNAPLTDLLNTGSQSTGGLIAPVQNFTDLVLPSVVQTF